MWRTFIPVIVTNAKLLSGTYNSSDINNDASLTKIDLQPIPVAAINHAEILKWGDSYKSTVSHIGQPMWRNMHMDDERYKGSHNKTVFVVLKDSLLNFIDHMIDLK